MAKNPCPISRVEFRERAKPIRFTSDTGHTIVLYPRDMGTGSMGWVLDGSMTKLVLCLDGRDVPCQVSFNLTAIGSKDLPPDDITLAVLAARKEREKNAKEKTAA